MYNGANIPALREKEDVFMIQFGLRLHDAEKLPLEQVLPLVRQKGFTCAHVALSKSLKASVFATL